MFVQRKLHRAKVVTADTEGMSLRANIWPLWTNQDVEKDHRAILLEGDSQLAVQKFVLTRSQSQSIKGVIIFQLSFVPLGPYQINYGSVLHSTGITYQNLVLLHNVSSLLVSTMKTLSEKQPTFKSCASAILKLPIQLPFVKVKPCC